MKKAARGEQIYPGTMACLKIVQFWMNWKQIQERLETVPDQEYNRLPKKNQSFRWNRQFKGLLSHTLGLHRT